jgi:hypothetical protein
MTKEKKASVSALPTRFQQVTESARSNEIMMNINKLKPLLMLDNHVDVYMPNEIFKDLQSPLFTKWQEQAFAYTYYYAISYLFRNCIYGKVTDIKQVNLENIRKSFLGVAGKTLNGIYVKGGILDQMGYTCTLTDMPVYANLDGSRLSSFIMYRENNAQKFSSSTIPTNFMVKVPLKGLYSVPPANYLDLLKEKAANKKIEELLKNFDGHFFEVDQTHKLQLECFLACMSNRKLGYKGFYLYGFFRRQYDQFKGGYNASIKQIQKIIPISEQTLYQYTHELESLKLISKFVRPHKPNTYKATDHVPIIHI